MDKREFCEFYEQLLKAQLAVVRQFSGNTARRKGTAQKDRSRVGIAEDILEATGEPLLLGTRPK